MRKVLQTLMYARQKMVQWHRSHRTEKNKTLWEGNLLMIAIFYAIG